MTRMAQHMCAARDAADQQSWAEMSHHLSEAERLRDRGANATRVFEARWRWMYRTACSIIPRQTLDTEAKLAMKEVEHAV